MKANMQNLRKKQNPVYTKDLKYNKDVYHFSMKYEKNNQFYFLLILNETKYQKFFKPETEIEKEILKTIIQNFQDSEIIIKNISKNQASLKLKITLGSTASSIEITLEIIEKKKNEKFAFNIFDYNLDEIINKCDKGYFQEMFVNLFDDGYIIGIDSINKNYLLIFRSEITVNILKKKNFY